MKKLTAALAGVIALSTTVGVVYADNQSVNISLAEIGAVEQLNHPVLFGQDGIWELAINQFQAQGQNGSFSFTSSQLADLLEADIVQVQVEIWNTGLEEESRLNVDSAVVKEDGSAVLKIAVDHTYGTGEEGIWAKLRFSLTRSLYWDNDAHVYTTRLRNREGKRNILVLQRKDVLYSQPIEFTVHYNRLERYQSIILLDDEAISNLQVLADGEELYMAAGKDDILTIDFDEIAVYTTCVSAAQKTVNLFYSLDEVTEITKAYPDVSFQFISFPGNPSFINSGELSFQAVNGEETSVYSYNDGELVRLESEYDSVLDRVVIRGVKRLENYVVASESVENFSDVPIQ